ncbi:hypothetical protein ACFL2V_14330 [Pseudomonadota bacterium]
MPKGLGLLSDLNNKNIFKTMCCELLLRLNNTRARMPMGTMADEKQ